MQRRQVSSATTLILFVILSVMAFSAQARPKWSGQTPAYAGGELSSAGAVRQPPGPGQSPTQAGPAYVGWKPGLTIARRGLPDFQVDAFYPAQADGAFDYLEAPYPVVVMIQGGAVPVSEYYYLADRLASWGMVVILPYYPSDLAFYGPTRASAVVDWLERTNRAETFWKGGLDLTAVAVGGHSLGGVVADSAVDEDPRFAMLFLLASYPGDEDGALLEIPVLTVGGAQDCAATPEEVAAGYDTYLNPKAYAEIAGMTHYQFTASDEEDLADCPPGLPLEDAHAALSGVLVPFFRWVLVGDGSQLEAITQPPAGVSVELDWE